MLIKKRAEALFILKINIERKIDMKKFIKIGKLLFIFMMMFSIVFSNFIPVSAWDNSVPHEFTRIKNIKYKEEN